MGTIKKLLGGPNPFVIVPPNGTLVQARGTAPGVIADGKLVVFDSLSVAQVLSNPQNTISVDPGSYYVLPYSGTIRSKSSVISSPGYSPAFLTDQGEMKTVDCQEAIARNQSTVVTIPLSQYGNYPHGGSLDCKARVPSVIGLSRADASKTIKDAGFQENFSGPHDQSAVAVQQDPQGDLTEEKGTRISVRFDIERKPDR